MSTRSHIIVESPSEEHYVYHHCDGYLEGVGEELKDFIKKHYSPVDYTADEFCKQLNAWDDSYEYEDYGIHGDEEYLYYILIHPDSKQLSIYVKAVKYVVTEDGDWDDVWNTIDTYSETFKI